jgi:hypothetical protein
MCDATGDWQVHTTTPHHSVGDRIEARDLERNSHQDEGHLPLHEHVYHRQSPGCLVFTPSSFSHPQCIVARGWVPTSLLPAVQSLLASVASRPNSAIIHAIPCGLPKPTYFNTNKFTAGFLGIVEAYGVANYQEVNPGMCLCVSVCVCVCLCVPVCDGWFPWYR